jgi:2-C-methyl-D-erythritol 4-phosphate cytidylyltransferase
LAALNNQFNISAVVVAGGKSKRFKGKIKKQFFLVKGTPLFMLPARALDRLEAVREIIIVLPRSALARYKKVIERSHFRKTVKIVPGGNERYKSVRNALGRVSPDATHVLVQDGVRPLFEPSMLNEALKCFPRCDGAVVGVKMTDTVKQAKTNGAVRRTVPRRDLWRAQTPQIFKKEILLRAYLQKNISHVTDDSQAVELAGGKVKMIESPNPNIKITTTEDLVILDKYL